VLDLPHVEDSLEKLFKSGDLSDLEFSFRSTEFKLHCCVLSNWKYLDQLKNSKIHDPGNDFPVETFRKMILWFYTKKLDTISTDDAGWILTMKEFYLLDDECLLVRFCHDLVSDLD